MSNETLNRQRTRQDLQELAKLAKPKAASFETADSSGYVDLSAFSATDDDWVEREFARAKAGATAPARGKSAAINALSPESMAPVALSALLEVPPDETAPTRGRQSLYVVAGLASVAAVAALAVMVARQAPPPESKAAAAAVAVQPVPAETAAPEVAPPAATSVESASAPAPAAAPSTSPKTVVTTQAKKKVFTPARGPSATAAASHPAARPVVIPQSKPSSGGDSLMDMMRASVKSK